MVSKWRANYFELLKLDPDEVDPVRDRALIDKTIEDFRVEWKSKGGKIQLEPGLIRGQAEDLHRDMKAAETDVWKEHAKLERLRRNKRSHVLKTASRDLAEVLGTPILTEAAFKKFSDKLHAKEEENLQGSLEEQGLGLPQARSEVKEEMPQPDRMPFNTVRTLLNAVGLPDLYAFLNEPTEEDEKNGVVLAFQQGTPLDLLQERLSDISDFHNRIGSKYKNLTDVNKTLCGEGKKHFATREDKDTYDLSLAVGRLETLPAIVAAFSDSKVIHSDQKERLLQKAQAISGVSPIIAERYMNFLLAKSKISVATVGDSVSTSDPCPFCSHLVPKGAKTCPNCSNTLYRTCINCGSQCPVSSYVCAGCGMAYHADQRVRVSLKVIEAHLDQREFADATNLLSQLAHTAPDCKDITRLQKQVVDMRKEMADLQRAVHEHLSRGEAVEAKYLLERSGPILDTKVESALNSKISRQISLAQTALREFHKSRSAKKFGQAISHLSDAMSHAADYKDVKKAVAQLDPPVPATLEVTHVSNGWNLTWDTLASHSSEVTHVVVRTTNERPHLISDGKKIYEGRSGACRDTSFPVGAKCWFGVFTKAYGAISKSCRIAGPFFNPGPVENFDVEATEKEVDLSWVLPPGARDALIFRLDKSVTHLPAGAEPLATGKNGWTDSSAKVGQQYAYFVQPRFFVPGEEKPRYGHVVREEAGPTRLPTEIDRLKIAHSTPAAIRLEWSPIAEAGEEVERVLLFTSPPNIETGRTYTKTSLPARERDLLVARSGKENLRVERFEHLWAIVGRSRGSLVRCSPTVKVESSPSVTELQAEQVGGSQVSVSWVWPEGSTGASIWRRENKKVVEKYDRVNRLQGATTARQEVACPSTDCVFEVYAHGGHPELTAAARQINFKRKREVKITYWLEKPTTWQWLSRKSGQSRKTELFLSLQPKGLVSEVEVLFRPMNAQGTGDDLRIAKIQPDSYADPIKFSLDGKLPEALGTIEISVNDIDAIPNIVPRGGLTAKQVD